VIGLSDVANGRLISKLGYNDSSDVCLNRPCSRRAKSGLWRAAKFTLVVNQTMFSTAKTPGPPFGDAVSKSANEAITFRTTKSARCEVAIRGGQTAIHARSRLEIHHGG